MEFADWMKGVFGAEPKRFLDEEDLPDGCKVEASQMLAHLTRLFEEPQPLRALPEESVAQGLFFVLREEDWSDVMLDEDLPEDARIQCIDAMVVFFESFLFGEIPKALANVRYMWWDVFPTWGGDADPDTPINDALLRTMASIIGFDCQGCQDAAIHGLNHWSGTYPEEVVAILDAFLRDNPSTPLRDNVEAAKLGRIQ